MTRRSSLERLPQETLAVVHAAIHEGATIDETVARIRARGGACSRSAVTRYVRRMRDVLRRRSETSGLAELWLGTLGESADGGTGRLAAETLTALVVQAADALERSEEPPDIETMGALSLVLQRIETAGKRGAERESVVARSAARKAAGRTGPAAQGRGLSPRTVAHIRAAVEGYDPADAGEEICPETVARIRTAVADCWGFGAPPAGEE